MIEMKTAYTTEIDDTDAAWDELSSQIDFDGLRKNSVGVLSCHFDFVDSGDMKSLCERMKFPVAGMTTLASANKWNSDQYGFSLSVLTSDDETFQTAVTRPLSRADYQDAVAEAYEEARAKLPGDPAFIISFFPYLRDLSEPDLLKALDHACGGIPIWGSVATGIDMSYASARTLLGGGDYEDAMVMILIHGPAVPEFASMSIPEQNIRESKTIITDSEGCVLRQVNDIPIIDYMNSIGVVLREEDSTATPLMVDYGDGSKPAAAAIYHIGADGGLTCGAEMPKGAVFSVGEIDADGVLQTARACIDRILAMENKNGILITPCIIRYIILAPNQSGEADLARDTFAGAPYALAYAGGEICPVRDRDGKWVNRFHNYTFSACVF
jgi:hypothetical protein